MPKIEPEYGWKECVTHKGGDLRDRVLDRLDCESEGSAMAKAHMDAGFKALRASLYFSLAFCAAGLIFGIYLLTEREWIAGAIATIAAIGIGFSLAGKHVESGTYFSLATRNLLDYEASYWIYARMLAVSDEELCELGFPVEHRGVWIKRERDERTGELDGYEVLAIRKPEPESDSNDYLPRHVVDADSFREAKDLIDTMLESEELVEIDGQVVYP